MKKKTSKLKSKNAFNTPVFVVILVSLVIGYLYGQFKPFNKTGKRLLYDPVQNMEYESCPSSGQIPITEFLEVYTVKKGDTLLSIAKNELNDTSRASEIVALNKYLDRFPQLSLTNPFLEVGWKLYLPFEHASQTGGNIQAYAGNITGIDQGVFRISFQQGGGGSITPSTQTQFLLKQKNEYQVGDCVLKISAVLNDNVVLYVLPWRENSVTEFRKSLGYSDQ